MVPRLDIPHHEFQLHGGLITSFRQEDVGPNGLLQATNVDPAGGVDSVPFFRGVSKVPGSVRRSDTHGAAVQSIHYFEGFDLQSVLQRKVVSLAGGTVRFINLSTNALTTVATGKTSEALFSVSVQDRLYLASPNNLPFCVTVDGREYGWGLYAPGTAETTLDAFSSAASWTINGTNTKSDSSETSNEFPDTTTSVQVNKVDTSLATAILTKAGMGLDFSILGGDVLYLLLFVPSGAITSLVGTGTAVQVSYGDAGLANFDSHNFGVGDLREGWNLIACDVTEPDSETGSGATLATIDTVRLTITLASNATTQSGFLWSYMHKRAEGRPIASLGGDGDVTGGKSYVVTFVRDGFESNAGNASNTVDTASNSVILTNVPTSTDTSVSERRIYRDDSGDQVYRYVGSIFDASTTQFTDNVANEDLELTGPPLLGDPDSDHSPPPKRLRDAVAYRNHVLAISEINPFRIVISDVAEPHAWPSTSSFDFDEELTGLELHAGGVLVYSTDKTYFLSGSTIDEFTVEQMNPQVGCSGRRAHINAKGMAPIVLHDQGFWFVTDPTDPWLCSLQIQDIINALDASQFENAWFVHDRRRLRIICFIPSNSTTLARCLVYSYGKKSTGGLTGEGAGLDSTEIRSGGWFDLDWPAALEPRCAAVAENSSEEPIVLIGCTDGFVYQLNDDSASNWANGTGTSLGVEMTIETCDAPISPTADGRGTPRFVAVNGEFNQSTILNFTVETRNDADGKVNATRNWTTTFASGSQSKVISIPAPGMKGSWARVKITNGESGANFSIKSLRLYYIPSRIATGPR